MRKHLAADRDYKLWALLYQAFYAVYRAWQRELSQYGLSPSRDSILFAIEAIGNKATPSQLSKWLPQEPNSISILLTRMVKQGHK